MQIDLFWAAVLVVLSTVSSFLIAEFFKRRSNVGTLRIDRSDPEEPPYFFLEVTNVSRIKDGKTITMTVKEENYISQE